MMNNSDLKTTSNSAEGAKVDHSKLAIRNLPRWVVGAGLGAVLAALVIAGAATSASGQGDGPTPPGPPPASEEPVKLFVRQPDGSFTEKSVTVDRSVTEDAGGAKTERVEIQVEGASE